MQPLFQLCQQGHDAELVSNGRAALVSSCEHLDARRMLAPLLTESEQVQLLFQGRLPPVPPDYKGIPGVAV
jgi:hypothetical protein